jgi:hypothetical protein
MARFFAAIDSIDACQRFGLARSVLAAWGEPARPGFPPEGETGKGAFSLLAVPMGLGPTNRDENLRAFPRIL